MNRIKHIALHTEDPVKTAEYYKEVFGLEELHRQPKDSGEDGVWLSDGYIFFAIRKYGSEDAPNLGEGCSTVPGVHHIGFLVDDLDESVAAVEGAGGTECPGSTRVARKYKGPDGLMVDMVPWATPYWDDMIKAKTQLLHAVPAPDVPASASPVSWDKNNWD